METHCSIAADHPDHLSPRRLSNIGSARESQCRPVRPVKLFHSRLGEYGVAQSGGKRRQERTEWRSEESGGEGRQARDSTPNFVPTHTKHIWLLSQPHLIRDCQVLRAAETAAKPRRARMPPMPSQALPCPPMPFDAPPSLCLATSSLSPPRAKPKCDFSDSTSVKQHHL